MKDQGTRSINRSIDRSDREHGLSKSDNSSEDNDRSVSRSKGDDRTRIRSEHGKGGHG